MADTTPIAPQSIDYSACHSGEATGMGGRVAATTAADIGTLRVSVGGIGEVSDPASFFMCTALCISLILSDLF